MSFKASAKVILCGEHFVLDGVPAIGLPLTDLLLEVKKPLNFTSWPPSRETIDPNLIESSIPRCVGLGSSAALGIALAKSCFKDIDAKSLRQSVRLFEDQIHGKSSGVDAEIILQQKCISFRTPDRFRVLPDPNFGLLIINAGPRPPCAHMIQKVNDFKLNQPDRWSNLSLQMTTIAEGLESLILDQSDDIEHFATLIRRAHSIHQKIGISSPSIESTIDQALHAGAYAAKSTGAGGGGAVLAICPVDEIVEIRQNLDAGKVWAQYPSRENFAAPPLPTNEVWHVPA